MNILLKGIINGKFQRVQSKDGGRWEKGHITKLHKLWKFRDVKKLGRNERGSKNVRTEKNNHIEKHLERCHSSLKWGEGGVPLP